MDEIADFEKVSSIISREEVETFYSLLKKMHKANAVLEELENQEPKVEKSEGIVPYEISIGVTCIVTQKGSSMVMAPSVVEKLQKIYYIDMTTDNYSDMVEAFLDKITDTLSNTCSDFIPKSIEGN